METSKIGDGKQAIIPDDVWVALGLEPGDELAWTIADGHVRVTRAGDEEFTPEQRAYIQAAWTEGINSGESNRTFEDIVRAVLGDDD